MDDTASTAQKTGIKAYQPLGVILVVILLASVALGQAGLSVMHVFMGLFFTLFALFKLFDPRGFADGFAHYDIIAKRWRFYAYLYPVIELGLGMAYLAYWQMHAIYIATIVVMAISAIGIMGALAGGRPLNCACLGTTLNVPLGAVSVLENLGMLAMAAYMLLA